MIDKISVSSLNSGKTSPRKEPSFKGLDDFALGAIQMCEQNPMVNVAVLDLTTAIIPRTIVEGQTNPYAGFEAFRRESSGLIVNCMIPSLIVLGIAKVIQGPIMGTKSEMSNCWANEDTIKLVTKYWQESKGKTDREKVYNTIKKILEDTEGVDGDKLKSFKGMNFNESIEKLTENVFNQKYSKKEIKAAYKSIIDQTHIAENIKIKGHGNGFFSQNLESVIGNTPKILRELVGGKYTDAASFASKAKRLLTSKSLLGLGVVLPLAISMQPLNRWITEKSSGQKGAPIYKDFGKARNRELSSEEKASLFAQKLLSVGLLVGSAMLSMMKLPSLQTLKNISQFKGIFPSMDQARLIYTTTCSSRIMASEDKNDLREATVRDIATLGGLYFIGDYVAKGLATLIQKTKGIELINILKEPPGKDANVFKKFWHWMRGTALKSSDEIYGKTAEATKYAKKMRSLCQIGNIAFSLIILGVLIPKMNRKRTEKEHEKELKKVHTEHKKAA